MDLWDINAKLCTNNSMKSPLQFFSGEVIDLIAVRLNYFQNVTPYFTVALLYSFMTYNQLFHL